MDKQGTIEKQDHVFTFRRQPVHYTTFGKGKPLLVLHGWGSNRDVMMSICSILRIKRTFYLLDFPGFGNSPEPTEAWYVDDYTDLVATFIREKKLPKSDILAHSFGGRVTLKLCARPEGTELIDKVLITGGAGMKPRRPPLYYIKKYTAKTLKFPFTLLPAPLAERGLTWLRSTPLWKSLGSSDYKTLSGVMRETFVRTVSEYLEPTLPKIPHEVLLLWGVNDDATPMYQAERMEKGIRNAGLARIDQAGHYAFLDRPQQFRIITETFFK
jgi:pimeloyl-ACP methyl ester carboxylesterase